MSFHTNKPADVRFLCLLFGYHLAGTPHHMSGPRFLQAGEVAIATEGIEWLKGKDGVNDPLTKKVIIPH